MLIFIQSILNKFIIQSFLFSTIFHFSKFFNFYRVQAKRGPQTERGPEKGLDGGPEGGLLHIQSYASWTLMQGS